ncbi:Rho termination factor N-terminal domain-containing protein [Clostridium perfringens]|uniref:Rho termination factor-like N-terminal domain-containing protein n=1 Tax=Clostridium perfringens TaxID=1502 RepID=A0AAP7BV77_CLOPF|nr:Rho termination factor N-terminal domain-containing protein [Clostridium perfringens]ELC8385980.1 Rho termination factor N-terminal domain-containing protein [Clostridium perfringens]MCX0373387.1 Rho termination factor N-terminal domain-containing protein [Clostridium perfringens]MCX0402879.1 Rho termination factor N-terminal domain-containing protein [Clostridium perfringens]MDK0607912.1 Rho termination factor N-terminal domain-containing protein [Clostridium perfringens]MDM0756783.1 Rho t
MQKLLPAKVLGEEILTEEPVNLNKMNISELKDMAKNLKLEFDSSIKKNDLIKLISDKMGEDK